MHRFILILTSLFLLASCSVKISKGYSGPDLPPEQLAFIWPISGIMGISRVNDQDLSSLTGGADVARIKPGINEIDIAKFEDDYTTKKRYTNRWTVKFKAEAGHMYVFYTEPTLQDHRYYLNCSDLGTNYQFDENKPLSIVKSDARYKGKKVKFLK